MNTLKPRPRGDRGLVFAAVTAAAGALLLWNSLGESPRLGAYLSAPVDPETRVESLRLLRAFGICGSLLLGAFAVLLAVRGSRLRRLRGLFLLDRHPRTALAVLGLLQVVGLFVYLPPGDLLRPEPIFTCDHACVGWLLFRVGADIALAKSRRHVAIAYPTDTGA